MASLLLQERALGYAYGFGYEPPLLSTITMMTSLNPILLLVLVFTLLPQCSLGLNTDGLLLLSFKLSILQDPQQVLQTWSPYDETPCSWRGVTCATILTPPENIFYPRVVSLNLPSSQLVGSIPSNLGMIEQLQSLNLSNNSLNGSLPLSLFNSTNLQALDLAFNRIAGVLPHTELPRSLSLLNLSDNALEGKIPTSLGSLTNLTVVYLKNNYFSGEIPAGFEAVEVLDLSSNLINGSLPSDFGGDRLRYFNVSHNGLSGEIPAKFAERIPINVTLDFSFNNLTGAIPKSQIFLNQETASFRGNPDLCGEETEHNPCPIPSSPASNSPNSPPAFAAIPRLNSTNPDSVSPGSANASSGKSQTGLKTATIVGIVAGDVAGIAVIAMVFLYVIRLRKKKKEKEKATSSDVNTLKNEPNNPVVTDWSSSSSESRGFTRWSCLRNKKGEAEEESSDSSSSDSEEAQMEQSGHKGSESKRQTEQEQSKGGTLVTLDGEKKLELETLLKASAYILGATGSSIMYKAVLEDGSSLAVRRIGEHGVDRFKDFENQIRLVAKLVHPNLVRIRGFFWGVDEKLIIYDFVPNGCLANARYRKVGSSPCHLPWEARLRIAKGVARGLGYLHEKKHVHGNLKPTNILLGVDMEPKIGDFGLEKLLSGDTSYKIGSSTRNFGSKRSTASRDSFQDFALGPSPGPSPSPSAMGTSPYHAPESLRSLKPHPKWDVYSFGVILLELITGKVVVVDELGQGLGLPVDDPNRALRMADMAIRGELEGKEEPLLALFKLGYSCASPVPPKRPAMKEALQVLEKFPCSPSSSYYYGHL
ncbi:probable LRR receptor-like serine/threonine-protein kinase At4g37250 [Argentina anserina]|uniref:probable LRR receptor-like serine/threonine-protein kinase At4g37250 n=1 Tax=Argentina anserina TaxID=57926 RepID=UPI002176836D|nr:probable LRR receptor-like serine/threonine-protein kinase At4g37250 [Potentilla anserina]